MAAPPRGTRAPAGERRAHGSRKQVRDATERAHSHVRAAVRATGLLLVVIRCPKCNARNAVDARRTGLFGRSRCGQCGLRLPWRLPSPVLVALGLTAVVLIGVAYWAVDAVQSSRAVGRHREIARLVNTGHAADAVSRLRRPRPPLSDEADLARHVARALAEPVLQVAAAPNASEADVRSAIERGDDLLAQYGDLEGTDGRLPEIQEVLDEPLRRLTAQVTAKDVLAPATALVKAGAKDLDAVERAVASAASEVSSRPRELQARVAEMSAPLLARARLVRARGLLRRGRLDEASEVLARDLGPSVVPVTRDGEEPEPTREGVSASAVSATEQAAALRHAVEQRDLAALEAAVAAGPPSGAPGTAGGDVEILLPVACRALASLAAERAAAATDPRERADNLLVATTCDDALPASFVRQARAAAAHARVEQARTDGSFRAALEAVATLPEASRDPELAALGCAAELGGDVATAVRAFSAIASRAVLRSVAGCDVRVQAPALPSLDYPSDLPAGG